MSPSSNDPETPMPADFLPSEIALGLVESNSKAIDKQANSTPAASQNQVQSNNATTGAIFTTAPAYGPIAVGPDGAKIDKPTNNSNYHISIKRANISFRSGQETAVTAVQNINAGHQGPNIDDHVDNRTVPPDDIGTATDHIRPLRLRDRSSVTYSLASPSNLSTATANENASRPLLETVEHHVNDIKATGESAEKTYRRIRKLMKKPLSLYGGDQIGIDMRLQELLLKKTNIFLIRCLSDFPIEGNTAKDDIGTLWEQANGELHSIDNQLKEGLSYIRKTKPTRIQDPNAANRHVEWFMRWFRTLCRLLNGYTKSADGLSGGKDPWANDESRLVDFKLELTTLLNEEETSLRLKQCLCQACPEQCHRHHTAYFSLEPQRSIVNWEANDERHIEMDGTANMWQCHMAFKSTVASETSLIWLKVVSNMTARAVTHSVKETSEDVEDQVKMESSMEGVEDTKRPDLNTRKHRATSPLQQPEPKAQKRVPHQTVRHMPAPGPGIEVCLEYLAQHSPTQYAIMKMIDSSGCNHRLFYLPEERRSAYGVDPDNISLRTLLNQKIHRGFDILQVLRLARLVAEAVVRFDLDGSDGSPKDRIVFYGLPTEELVPFLEVVIMKPKCVSLDGYNNSDDQGRCEVLLELGEILLELGLEQGEELPRSPLRLDLRRNHIIKHAKNVALGTIRYSEIIKNCVYLTDETQKQDKNNGWGFREGFYQKIVQPLKDIEDQLLSQEKEGKRWSGIIKGMPVEYGGGNAKLERGSEAHI